MSFNATHECLPFTIVPAVFLCNLCWSMLPVKGNFSITQQRDFGSQEDGQHRIWIHYHLRVWEVVWGWRYAGQREFLQNQRLHRKRVFFLYGLGQWDPQTENCLGCLNFQVATLRRFYCVCILFTASSLAPTKFPNLRLESCVASDGLL